jgi:hypothetical protein
MATATMKSTGEKETDRIWQQSEHPKRRVYCCMWSRCHATTARWADIPGSFLENELVNTFPQQRIDAQQ